MSSLIKASLLTVGALGGDYLLVGTTPFNSQSLLMALAMTALGWFVFEAYAKR